ncbi:YiiX family permuted papain-like enzyme [Bernardetia sp. ABR2-2B]|uniref:YiiX family permuted papain-like enzyme n=1 Tax=Bernardetia sp. ABR2-2B TaxID=3127472 RepID=UPI0030D143FB
MIRSIFKIVYLLSFLFSTLSCTTKKSDKPVQSLKENLVQKQKQTQENNIINEGDIIFQTSISSQSKAIQLATHSKYSHVGIIFKSEKDSTNFLVLEAVQPVKFTPLKEWIKRGQDAHFVIKRLKNADKILTFEALHKMKNLGKTFLGKNYDLYFEWSDERIYCSELVWKIYKEGIDIEIGELEKLSSFDLESKAVREKMKERYKNQIPYDENVISPAAIFQSDKLISVPNPTNF